MSLPNGSYAAPLATTSSTDRSGALLIVNIVCLVISLFSVAVRLHMSSRETKSRFAVFNDDLLCYLAEGFCIIGFGLVWAQVVAGEGRTAHNISPENLIRIQKLQYAQNLIYTCSVFCSRTSIIFLLERLQGMGRLWLWKIALGVMSAWFIATMFVLSLKCDLHHPWIQYHASCPGLNARWQASGISGIIIEFALFSMAIYLVSITGMKLSAKVKVVVLFGTRVIVVILIILRLISVRSETTSSDFTFFGVNSVIYAIAFANASVVTATTPLLKPFLLKFKVIGANSASVIKPPKPLYASRAAADHDDPERGSAEAEKPSAPKKKRRRALGLGLPSDIDTVPGTLSDESWMPSASSEATKSTDERGSGTSGSNPTTTTDSGSGQKEDL